MKALSALLPYHFLVLALGFVISCSAQESEPKTILPCEAAQLGPLTNNGPIDCNSVGKPAYNELQIAEFVRRVFEDRNGHLWLATNNYGVARYDGDTLTYFSPNEGLAGRQVTAILEDQNGHLWFGTDGGISRYNGSTFTNFSPRDGLNAHGVWALFEDNEGIIWAGTTQGVSQFNGTRFTPLIIPKDPKSDPSSLWITSITQDSKGLLWFGIRGMGACSYDGATFSFLTKEDGLCDNDITKVLEDRNGNMWFGSMFGGLCRYDGTTFTYFNTSNSIGDDEVWDIYEDVKGNIWCSSEGYGIYRIQGKNVKNYDGTKGLPIGAVQCIFQDKNGLMWIGGAGGLYMFQGSSFTEVTKNGPWDPC